MTNLGSFSLRSLARALHSIRKPLLWGLGIAILLGAITYWVVRHRAPVVVSDSNVDSTASRKAPFPARDPARIHAWVRALLERNEYPSDAYLQYMREVDTGWVVDLRPLRLWTLPPADYGRENPMSFPDSVRIAGGTLCGELPASVDAWLTNTLGDWRKTQRCSPSQFEEDIRAWTAQQDGQVRLRGLGKDDQGRVVSLSMACSSRETVFDPRRLLADRDLRRLELDGCSLSEQDEDGWSSSSVQPLLAKIPIRTLIMRNGSSPYLNLSAMDSLDTLEVEGGDLSRISLYPRRRPIGRIHFSEVALCDDHWDSVLVSQGAQIDSVRCAGVPRAVLSMVSKLKADFESEFLVSGGWGVDTSGDQTYREILHDLPESKPRWKGFASREFFCQGEGCYIADPVRVYDGWVRIPSQGDFYLEGMVKATKGRLKPGMSRAQVHGVLTDNFGRAENFEVWADQTDKMRLILHFQEDQLDAVWVPDEFWSDGWVADRRKSWRAYLTSE
ncbi:MAG: hypothetical protein IPK50_11760 [Fibrobacterota bacterium]|nr:hypothetical protein [Fibrobacterota bacterium]QQS07548.1 MAG: hypothetical protein IPK50_11760 [Fibrobacterota bacterium]